MVYQPVIYEKSDFKKLQQIFARSWQIPFYKRLYKETSSPKTIQSINDLIKLPIISRKLLFDRGFVKVKDLLKIPHYLINARVNPNGDEVVYPLSVKDFTQYIQMEKFKFFFAGVKPNDRCSVVAFSQNATIPMSQALLSLKATYVPLDGDENSIFSAIVRQKITVLFTVPQVLYRLIDYVKIRNISTSLRMVITTGVHIYNIQETETKTKQILGADLVDSIGATELASFAVSCRSKIDHYHFINELMIVEIINPETHLPDKKGEIVITPLWKRDYPLIRYGTGDYVELTKNNNCSCNYRSKWIFGGIVKKLDNTTRIERYMTPLSEIYENTARSVLYQTPVDKLIWRIFQPPIIIMLIVSINYTDTILIFIEKSPSILTLRRNSQIVNYVTSISSAKVKIVYCNKKELISITPKYLDLRNAKYNQLSSPLQSLIHKYKAYFL